MSANTIRKPIAAFALLAIAIGITACGGDDEGNGSSGGSSSLPTGSEPANLDPAEFTTEITNPYWPMASAASGSTGSRTPRATSGSWSP